MALYTKITPVPLGTNTLELPMCVLCQNVGKLPKNVKFDFLKNSLKQQRLKVRCDHLASILVSLLLCVRAGWEFAVTLFYSLGTKFYMHKHNTNDKLLLNSTIVFLNAQKTYFFQLKAYHFYSNVFVCSLLYVPCLEP